jgi:hypothetical protein
MIAPVAGAAAGATATAGAGGATAAGTAAVVAEPLAWLVLEQIGAMMLSAGIIAIVPLALRAVRSPAGRTWGVRVLGHVMLPLIIPIAKAAVEEAWSQWRSRGAVYAEVPSVRVDTLELVHAIPGRIRFRMERIKGNVVLADEIARLVSTIDGVEQVETNTHTGSVLVHYDAERIKSFSLLAFKVETV